jgi:hypothetical protein
LGSGEPLHLELSSLENISNGFVLAALDEPEAERFIHWAAPGHRTAVDETTTFLIGNSTTTDYMTGSRSQEARCRFGAQCLELGACHLMLSSWMNISVTV